MRHLALAAVIARDDLKAIDAQELDPTSFERRFFALPAAGSREATLLNYQALCVAQSPVVRTLLDAALGAFLNSLPPGESFARSEDLCSGDSGRKRAVIDQALAWLRTHNAGMPDVDASLRPIVIRAFDLNRNDSQTAARTELIKQELSARTGAQCPRTLTHDTPECACYVAESVHALHRLPLDEKTSARMEALRERSREDYLDLVRKSRLSPTVKERLLSHAIENFPPFEVRYGLELDAHYGESPEHVGIDAGSFLVPGWPETVMKHELGHYFESQLSRASVVAALTEADRQILGDTRDCLDRNTLLGEFSMPRNFRSHQETEAIIAKRRELWADVIAVEGLREGGIMDRRRDLRQFGFLCGHAPPDPRASPGKSGFDVHAHPNFRLPFIAHGLGLHVPAGGTVAEPEECGPILFNRPARR